MSFKTPIDITNRALQLLRRPSIYAFDEPSVEAHETNSVYEQLRQSELRRACWRTSTRRVILRAISNTSMMLVPPAWAVGTAYISGDVISYSNQVWVALLANTGNTPGVVPTSGVLYWDCYFGPMAVDLWTSTTYVDNELVYKTDGIGNYTVYRSLISNNTFDPAAVDTWDSGVNYSTGQVVVYSGTNYQSRHNLNCGHQPDTSTSQWTLTITSSLVSNSWVATTATLGSLNIIYPVGAGPCNDGASRNVFVLPAGFLRQAPTDPKSSINPYLGVPAESIAVDWLFESNYIVSITIKPIMLRFVCDMKSVVLFDPMFAESLATRIALELAPRLADAEHMQTIIATCRENYNRTISEARTINGIETGTVDPVEDDYLVARF